MSKTIVFIHGAWMTPLCWENFKEFFEHKGYTCLAPAWPYKDRPIEELRQNPLPELGKLGITEIVDHYDKIIRALPEPPILIGHSFGGLFVQILLDRGLGSAGVAIDSAPPKGILPFYPSAIRSNLGVLLTPGFWNRVVRMSYQNFRYAFVHLLPEADQKAAYDKYVVPDSGRIFFQAITAMSNNTTHINFANAKRSPLLLVAGEADHLCPAAENRVNYERYKNSGAKTDLQVFKNRTHWIIAQPDWEEVADYIAGWLEHIS